MEEDEFLPVWGKYRKQLGFALLAASVLGASVWIVYLAKGEVSNISNVEIINKPPSQVNGSTTSSINKESSPAAILVDVSGAVASPGVYALFAGSRVNDAIAKAGGVTSEVDQEALAQSLNLAAKLADGDKLYVPKAGDNTTLAPAVQSSGQVAGSSSDNCRRVNINTAPADLLDRCLPGVGPSIAQSIVSFREQNGPFKAIEDVLGVSGIGDAKFAKIKDLIVVE